DVCRSGWESTLELGPDPGERGGGGPGPPPGAAAAGAESRPDGVPALRLGLSSVKGLTRAAGEAILSARRLAPFASVEDLARRARLSRPWMERLAAADALRSIVPDRRRALWRAL